MRSPGELFEGVRVLVHEADRDVQELSALLTGWMTTQGLLLFFSIVTGLLVLFTSTVTREKLLFASASPMVKADMMVSFRS